MGVVTAIGAGKARAETEPATGFRVANVICRFNSASGGPPRTVIAIAAAGVGHWNPELFATDYVESNQDRLLTDQFGGDVNLLAANAQTALGGLFRATRIFRSYEAQLLHGVAPDVIHIHGLWSPLLAAFAESARRNGIPYVVAPHGMLEPWSLAAHRVRKRLALRSYQGKILRTASAIHATSELEARHLRALDCIRCPIHVVPNIVDAPIVPRSAPPPTDRRRLLYLSRLHEKKGLDMLLQVWSELRPDGWDLEIVGSGEKSYVDRLHRYCREHRVPNAHFRAHVDGEEREAAYARASAFVLPTYSENFGNVVAEAMIRGLPVITTTGTPWSDVREHRLGWYIEPTPAALKSALVELLQVPQAELRAMGERARGYAECRFLVDAVRGRLLEMYHSVLRN